MAAGILLRTYKLDARRIYEKNKGFQDFCISSIKSGTLCVRLRPFLFPYGGGGMWDLNSQCKIDQADFTDWISFLLFNLAEEALSTNP